jgi:hypothetical protein
MFSGLWSEEGMKRRKCKTGSLETLDASVTIRAIITGENDMLTQSPFGGVHKYCQVIVGQPKRIIRNGSKVKRQGCIELYLTLDGKVVEGAQRI